ncbi:uncharacterized protein LOC132544168 [Ylistrum balloti]|uniref:uncharacterized protein LOC132544168 n=1 Tax=Ylistrum balloti TaxID=509963 RepID=UPI002905F783|nr:uncharacterized protein LOC132544168 [Ylistrum balloti]
MATKSVAVLCICSALTVLFTIVIIFVPSLISYTMCFNMTQIQPLMAKMSSEQSAPANIPATTLLHDVPSDFQMSMSIGIFRMKIRTTAPLPFTLEGNYGTLADIIKTNFNLVKAQMHSMGMKENAAGVLANLIRTMYIRVELEMAISLIFACLAFVLKCMSTIRRGNGTKAQPLTLLWLTLCHTIQALLLGVALSPFAQQMHQITSIGEIHTMIKIKDQGIGLLVMGFAVVLVSILLAITHLWMLVSFLRNLKQRGTETNYSLLESHDLSE